jgi:hypothetical protein
MNPLPSDNTIASVAEFIPEELRPGDTYEWPLKASHEHGVTHNNDGTAFALNSVVDSVWVTARLDGSEVLIAGNVPYATQAKMKNGDASQMGPVDMKVEALMESGELYRELNLLYGAGTGSTVLANIGVVANSVSGADLGTPQVVNLTAASYSPGLWNNMTNALVDIYQSDLSTLRASDVKCSAIATSTCRVTLTKSGSSATVASGDVIALRSSKGKQCYGLQAILENSGSLFNISAANYPFWQALSVSAGGALTIAEVRQAMAKLHNNGLKDGGTLFVSSATFEDFVAELDSSDRWNDDNTGKPKRVGVDNIQIISAAGTVDIAIHTYMKQGIAMFLPNGKVKRVGAVDLTFSLPGSNEWFYVELEGNAGGQMRIYSHQAIVVECPYHAAIFTGITNNADVSPA